MDLIIDTLRQAWIWLNGMTDTYEYQRNRRRALYSRLLNEELYRRTHNQPHNPMVIRACCSYLNTKPIVSITAAMQTTKENLTTTINKAI